LFLATVVATAYLAVICPKGFIPSQDTGQILGNTDAVQDVSFASMRDHQAKLSDIMLHDPNIENFMSAVGSGGANANMNSGRMMIALKDRSQRKLTADQVIQELRRKASGIPGIKLYMQNPPSIRMGGQSTKALYQVTLQGTSLPVLYHGVDLMLAKMKTVPSLQDPTPDTSPTSLQAVVNIDRDKAAALGISAIQVDQALQDAYGTSQVAQIYTDTNEYQVILELRPDFYRDPNQMSLLYVSSSTGKRVPLKAFANVKIAVGPLTVTHLGQLPSATISFNLSPGASLSDAVSSISAIAKSVLPDGATSTFQGNAQAFQSAIQDMLSLTVVAILVIYIVLGSLYESFIHPLTILTGLPAAGLGAIATLMLFGRALDIYGFLGMVMLIGIVKKNAIMMIDHALEVERGEGLEPAEAIHRACLVRFRPIMMTTVAALMGTLPLATGLGAGGEARQPLGLAVVGGLMVSQLLTLFITPVIYIYFDEWSIKLFGKPSKKTSHAKEWLSGSP
jgi:HAE1 family hydrophobic/amphiphilic exporter-1